MKVIKTVLFQTAGILLQKYSCTKYSHAMSKTDCCQLLLPALYGSVPLQWCCPGQREEIRHYILFACLLGVFFVVGFFCLVAIRMHFVPYGCRAIWFMSVQSIKLSRQFCNEAWGVFKSLWWSCKELSSAKSSHNAFIIMVSHWCTVKVVWALK